LLIIFVHHSTCKVYHSSFIKFAARDIWIYYITSDYAERHMAAFHPINDAYYY